MILKLKRFKKIILKISLVSMVSIVLLSILSLTVFYILSLIYPFPKIKVNEMLANESTLILDQDNNMIDWHVNNSDNWKFNVKIKDISPHLVNATIAAEDKRFRSHYGVDPLAIIRACYQNMTEQRRVSGASTISMQVIRLLWDKPRTLKNKIYEAFRAFQLEQIYTKDEIMEIYLNLAPYGGNVIGCEAASRRYFGKSTIDLTVGESNLLAGIPQRPTAFNPYNNLKAAFNRRNYVLDRSLELNYLTINEVKRAKREIIKIRKQKKNTRTPGFADYIINECNYNNGIIKSTINAKYQDYVNQIVSKHYSKLNKIGVDGLGVIVIDVEHSKVVAYSGNPSPSSLETGCINAVTIMRQPGSTLKPFIYGTAYEQGILTPRSIVYDVPTSWQDYRPQNIDLNFLGPISAAKALSLSRNVPAVRVLDKLNLNSLTSKFNKMNFDIHNVNKNYGLSIALGTKEIKLKDLANAYAALVRNGKYKSLNVLDDYNSESKTILSPEASYLVLRSLGANDSQKKANYIWKTGTSWGHRDAWTIIMSPKYVVATWCGNFSGVGHPFIQGNKVALPIASDIISKISPDDKMSWKIRGETRSRLVCALSGNAPNNYCTKKIYAEFIPGVSNDIPCRLHILRNKNFAINWPKDVSIYMDGVSNKNNSIEIISPAPNAEYVISPFENLSNNKLIFKAASALKENNLNWFLNGKHLGATLSYESMIWKLEPGTHKLTVTDNDGVSQSLKFTVLKK